MKVLFSNPPWWDFSELDDVGGFLRAGVRAGSRWPFTHRTQVRPDEFRFGEYLPFPFFLSYAASYVQRAFPHAEVVLRDSIARRESYNRYMEWVKLFRPDVIFIESATPSWEHDSHLIQHLARALPATQIVVCGPIASAQGAQILRELPVVAALQGEYEKGAVKVLQGARGVLPHDLLTLEEMNAAPFPLWPVDTATHYWDACPVGQQAPQAQVWSSRGCPYKCIFCVWPATMTGHDPDGTHRRTVRHYSADYMAEYLARLVADHGFRSIYFDDDTFNLGDRHVLAMCEVMGKLGLPWSAMCRADTVKRETWRAMKAAGCFGVKLGFESGNQHVVDHIVNKRLNLEEARQTVFFLKEIGFTVHGTFTFGLPGETAEQRADTRRYIASLPLDTHQESGTAEIEGTPLHTLRSAGHLAAYDSAKFAADAPVESDGQRKIEDLRNSAGT